MESQNRVKSAVLDPGWTESCSQNGNEAVRLLREAQEAGIIGKSQAENGTAEE